MESENNTSPAHAYPNADRTIGEPETTPAAKPLVHIGDAIKNSKDSSEDGSSVKTIRTYQGDIASAVRTDNMSVIKIALAEKKRQEQKGTTEEIQKESQKGLIIGSVAGGLVIVGILAIFFGYAGGKVFNSIPVSTSSSSAPSTLFFKPEKEVSLDVTNADNNQIKRLVLAEKQNNLPLGSIEKINFVQKFGSSTDPVPTSNLLVKFRSNAPDSLVRTLSTNYFFGIYSYNSAAKDSFLLVNVDSYDQGYAGMLEWENDLKATFASLFTNPAPVSAALPTPILATTTNSAVASTSASSSKTAIATTTSSSTQATSANTLPTPVDTGTFVDRIIGNKDTRVLVDAQGRTLLIYSFIDIHTLLIVSSETMFKEINARLTTGRIVR